MNYSELRGKQLCVYRVRSEEEEGQTVSLVVAPADPSLIPGVEVTCEEWAATLFSVTVGGVGTDDDEVAVCRLLVRFDYGAWHA